MGTILLPVAWLAFVVLSWRRVIWGISLVIILLPSYLWRFNFFGLPTTFLEITILSLLLIWILKNKNYRRINWRLQTGVDNPVPKTLRYLLAAWLLASLLALALHPSYQSLGLWRAYWLEPLLFFIIFVYNVRQAKELKTIISALGVLVFWLTLLSVYQSITDWNLPAAYMAPNERRLTAIFSYPNALGLLVAPIAALFAGLYLVTSKNNFLYLATFVLGFLLAWWSKSEGALLAIILSLAIYLLVLIAKIIKKQFGQRGVMAAAVIFLLALVGLYQGQWLVSFRQQIFQPQLDLRASSLEIRSSQWQETWQMLKNNLWSGAGIGRYQVAMADYHQVAWLEIYLYPHNIFLNFWSELGLVGLVVFLLLLFYIVFLLKKLFEQRSYLSWPLTLLWLTWLLHGLVDVPYFKNDLSALFFVFLGLTMVAGKYKNQFTV